MGDKKYLDNNLLWIKSKIVETDELISKSTKDASLIGSLRAENRTLNSSLLAIHQTLQSKDSQIEHFENTISNLTSQRDSGLKIIEKKNSLLQEKDSQIDSLRKNLSKIPPDNTKLIESLKNELQNVQNQLKSAQDRLSEEISTKNHLQNALSIKTQDLSNKNLKLKTKNKTLKTEIKFLKNNSDSSLKEEIVILKEKLKTSLLKTNVETISVESQTDEKPPKVLSPTKKIKNLPQSSIIQPIKRSKNHLFSESSEESSEDEDPSLQIQRPITEVAKFRQKSSVSPKRVRTPPPPVVEVVAEVPKIKKQRISRISTSLDSSKCNSDKLSQDNKKVFINTFSKSLKPSKKIVNITSDAHNQGENLLNSILKDSICSNFSSSTPRPQESFKQPVEQINKSNPCLTKNIISQNIEDNELKSKSEAITDPLKSQDTTEKSTVLISSSPKNSSIEVEPSKPSSPILENSSAESIDSTVGNETDVKSPRSNENIVDSCLPLVISNNNEISQSDDEVEKSLIIDEKNSSFYHETDRKNDLFTNKNDESFISKVDELENSMENCADVTSTSEANCQKKNESILTLSSYEASFLESARSAFEKRRILSIAELKVRQSQDDESERSNKVGFVQNLLCKLWKVVDAQTYDEILNKLSGEVLCNHSRLIFDFLYVALKAEKTACEEFVLPSNEFGLPPLLTSKQKKVVVFVNSLNERKPGVISEFLNYLYYSLFGREKMKVLKMFQIQNFVRVYGSLARLSMDEERMKVFVYDVFFFVHPRNHAMILCALQSWPDLFTWRENGGGENADPILEVFIWLVYNSGPTFGKTDHKINECRQYLRSRCGLISPYPKGVELIQRLLSSVKERIYDETYKSSVIKSILLLVKWKGHKWTTNNIIKPLFNLLKDNGSNRDLLKWVVEAIGLVARLYPIDGRSDLEELFLPVQSMLKDPQIDDSMEKVCLKTFIWLGHHFQAQTSGFLYDWKPKYHLDDDTKKLVENFFGTRADKFSTNTLRSKRTSKILKK